MTFTPSSSFRTCGNRLCRGCQQRAQGRRIRPYRDMRVFVCAVRHRDMRAFVCAMGGSGNQCVQKECMMSQDVGDTKGLTFESLSPICFSLFPNSTTDRTARFPESKSHISLSHSTRSRLGSMNFGLNCENQTGCPVRKAGRNNPASQISHKTVNAQQSPKDMRASGWRENNSICGCTSGKRSVTYLGQSEGVITCFPNKELT